MHWPGGGPLGVGPVRHPVPPGRCRRPGRSLVHGRDGDLARIREHAGDQRGDRRTGLWCQCATLTVRASRQSAPQQPDAGARWGGDRAPKRVLQPHPTAQDRGYPYADLTSTFAPRRRWGAAATASAVGLLRIDVPRPGYGDQRWRNGCRWRSGCLRARCANRRWSDRRRSGQGTPGAVPVIACSRGEPAPSWAEGSP